MAISNPILPAFDRPPVAETALGVEFVPLREWGVPHFGLFWHDIRHEYPKFQVQPPLGSQIERFDSEARPSQTLTFELGDPSRARCWFFHENDVQLLQLQDSRFILNWRKLTEDTEYPHYAQFRPRFVDEWSRFARFLERNGLGIPVLVQCEVTYVNIIPRGHGWQDYGELQKVTPAWSGKHQWLPCPESVALNARYVVPGNRGRLHVALQPVVRNADAAEALQLTLTARGHPSSPGLEGILDWFDVGHEWIVRGFTDLTSEHMHKLWKRSS